MFDRVFLFEVNGPTLPLVRERLSRLPHLRRAFETGAWGKLIGSLPPAPTAAMASLYTGMNPGRTGLFDFLGFPAGGYDRVPYDARRLESEPFFRRLSERGRRVGLLNVLLTHPLPDLDGFVVTADETAADQYAGPEPVLRQLRSWGYRVPFGAAYAPGRDMEFLEHTLQDLEMRRRALLELFGSEPWQFGMLSIFDFGELLHPFWRYYDSRHPAYLPVAEVFSRRDPLLEALKLVDRMVGEIVAMAGPGGLMMVMGAWGHRLEHTRVHVNEWLREQGHLRFRRRPGTLARALACHAGLTTARAEGLARRINIYKRYQYGMQRGKRASLKGRLFLGHGDIDWCRTRAAAVGYLGQVYLNVRNHRPHGVIPGASYDTEREQLRKRLIGMTDPRNGSRMIDAVHTRDEIYRGDRLTDAPDLIIQYREGYVGDDGFAGTGRLISGNPSKESSDHWQESFFCAMGQGVRPGEVSVRLEDIAPTILSALDTEIPDDLDGRVLPILNHRA